MPWFNKLQTLYALQLYATSMYTVAPENNLTGLLCVLCTRRLLHKTELVLATFSAAMHVPQVVCLVIGKLRVKLLPNPNGIIFAKQVHSIMLTQYTYADTV